MTEWLDVLSVNELETGYCKIVETDFYRIAIFHLDSGFYAIEDVCTHDGGDLASGEIEGNEIICPRHGARFCIRTGAVLTAPAYEDVQTFPVRVEAGRVQIFLEGEK
ncbi:MAG: non-heme iron oxygenase ferredoxin subunit [Mariprofundaceae bacterium]